MSARGVSAQGVSAGGVSARGVCVWQTALPCRQNDRQVKTLPCRDFVAGGKNYRKSKISSDLKNSKICFKNLFQQECIPVGCVPPACCTYLPACTAPGGMYLPGGGTWVGGVPAGGCTCLPGGCTCPGGCTWPGVYLPGR